MSQTPAAWLARLKVAFPRWSIQRVTAGSGTGFTASRGLPGGRSQSLYAPTLAELEYELGIATRAGPPGAGADVGRPHHKERLARLTLVGECEMTVLADRVAVVTGASSGIGAGLAAMLADEGARVVLAARRGEELERVAAGIRRAGGVAVPVVTDLADDESMARLLTRTAAELGPVDVLVNNAGFGLWKPLDETGIDEWDHTFAVNVRAAAYLCTAMLPGMQARRFGRVINIGSEAAVTIVPGLAAYCVSKHALRALTEVIQDANHDNGIKAWIICPGFVDTDMGEVVPGTNPLNFLRISEVVDMARYLIRLDYNVKLGPEILIRTMRNPMTT